MSAIEEELAGRILALAFVMALAEAMVETAKEISDRRVSGQEEDS
jgi:hypothetical protein